MTTKKNPSKNGDPALKIDPRELRSFHEGVDAFLNGRIGWRQLDAQDIRRIAADRGIPLSTLGEMIGVSRRTLYRWLDDPSSITPQMSVVLTFMDVCGDDVFHVMAEEARRMDAARGIERKAPAKPAGKGRPKKKNDAVPETFGPDEIRELRQRLGLSRAALGERLDVSEATVAKWEQGLQVSKGPALIALRLLWKKGRNALEL